MENAAKYTTRNTGQQAVDVVVHPATVKDFHPLEEFTSLNLSDRDLAHKISPLILTYEQLKDLGYPVPSKYPVGRTFIYVGSKSCHSNLKNTNRGTRSKLNIDAPDFEPLYLRKNTSVARVPFSSIFQKPLQSTYLDTRDSIHVGPKSKSCQSNPKNTERRTISRLNVDAAEFVPSYLRKHTFVKDICHNLLHRTYPAKRFINYVNMKSRLSYLKNTNRETISRLNVNAPEFLPSYLKNNTCVAPDHVSPISQHPTVERLCVRCERSFIVTSDGEYLTREQCEYHWGKLHQVNPGSDQYNYSCCGGSSGTKGCTICKLHVWNGYVSGLNGPFEGFVRTPVLNGFSCVGYFGVYAVDCEMSYTADGLDLTRVTVVKPDGRVVYDSIVKPDKEIIDYNSRFSGITAEDFKDPNNFRSLKQVQNDLLTFINEKSILIGHALNNDLRVLKLIHTRVIDTSILYPHYSGLPNRRSLKSLAKFVLKRPIQEKSTGHDSAEDARTCLALVLLHLTNKSHL